MIGHGLPAITTTEANFERTMREAGTFSNLHFEGVNNDINGASTFRARKNGANGNLSISIAASTSGDFEDLSNSDSVSAGDEYNYQLVCAGSSGDISNRMIEINFAPTDTDIIYQIYSQIAKFNETHSANQTLYYSITGDVAQTSTESNAYCEMLTPAVFKHAQVYISANTVSLATTFQFRVNGADGNIVISVTASTTGRFEDTSNTDTVADDDDVNWEVVIPNSGTNITIENFSIAMETSNNRTQLSSFSPAKSWTAGTGSDHPPISGYLTKPSSEFQVNTRYRVDEPYIAIEFLVEVSANSITSAHTLGFRQNQSYAMQVSVTALTTGTFTDTDAIELGALDALNYRVEEPANNSITLQQLSTLFTVTFERTVSETVTISESTPRTLGANRTASDTVTIAESISRAGSTFMRAVSEAAVTISESIQRVAAKSRSASDTVTVSDSASRQGVFNRIVAETITISELISRSGSVFVRAIIEGIITVSEMVTALVATPELNEGTDAIAHVRGTDAIAHVRGTDAIAYTRGTDAKVQNR